MRYSIFLLFVSSLALLTGCDVNISSENGTPTPIFVTATLPATAVPQPTQTLLPPTPMPTIPPIEGTTTTQINVRAETSTASENLGTIAQFSKVQIIGRDASTSWYQIIYTDAAKGTGWIRAEYVQVNAPAEIPVIESASGSGTGMSGLVIQKINVRSGPGVSYELLGELNPNDVVFITGKDESGTWMQIEFANSADGHGWASLEFLKLENADALPVVGDVNQPSATTASSVEEIAPTSLPLVAVQDDDSMQAPLTKISFSALGARTAQIQGDISSPNGDMEDWVEFTSYNGSIAIQLLCTEKAVQVELWNTGAMAQQFSLACQEKHLLNVIPKQTYWLRISTADIDVLQYTVYTLVMKSVR